MHDDVLFDGVAQRSSGRSRIGANGVDTHRTRTIGAYAEPCIRCLRIL